MPKKKRNGTKDAALTNMASAALPANNKKARLAATDTDSLSAYLSMESSTGGKYWSVYQHDTEVTISYGKIGSKGSTSTKTCKSAEVALKEAQSKMKQKLNKGYALVEGRAAVGEPIIAQEVTGKIKNLEDTLSIPIAITAYWRDIGDHTSDYVIKFVLRHTDGKYSVEHQQCNVQDGVFSRTEGHKDLPIEFDESKAKAVLATMVTVCSKAEDQSITRRFRACQNWSSIEITVESDRVPILSLIQKTEVKQSTEILKKDEKVFLDALQDLCGVGNCQLVTLDNRFYQLLMTVPSKEEWDMKKMPMYL